MNVFWFRSTGVRSCTWKLQMLANSAIHLSKTCLLQHEPVIWLNQTHKSREPRMNTISVAKWHPARLTCARRLLTYTICSNPSPVLHQRLQAKKRNSSHLGGEQEVLLKIHLLSWKQSGRRKSAEFVKEGKNLWYSIYTTLLIPRPNECWVVQPSTRSLKEHVATRGLNVCCCCVRCRAKKAL